MIVSSRSSVPLADIAALAKPSFWYQVYASDNAAKTQVQDAVKAGAKAIVITVGASHAANGARPATAASINWSSVDGILPRHAPSCEGAKVSPMCPEYGVTYLSGRTPCKVLGRRYRFGSRFCDQPLVRGLAVECSVRPLVIVVVLPLL
jgi:hypothetical protein